MKPYWQECRWCIGAAGGPTECTCSEPCARKLCPARETDSLYPEHPPVPTFQEQK